MSTDDKHRATVSPLCRVNEINVSEQSGTELNPHYLWLTREYTLHLACGHYQVRARFPGETSTDPQYLDPPLPRRVRCGSCAPVPSRGTGRKTAKAAPAFDPVMAALVTDMCRAQPERQDQLLDWIRYHGRYEIDETRRHRAYAAVARVVVDTYLPDTENERAEEVRAELEQWHNNPCAQTRAAVRTAAQRLYNTQLRDGKWFSHRGIISAAKLASPHPHNATAVTESPTWDSETRDAWAESLWHARASHDLHRDHEERAFRDGDTDDVAEHALVADEAARELDTMVRHHQPRIESRHLALCHAMLTAYRTAR